jgi:hypothetical protein
MDIFGLDSLLESFISNYFRNPHTLTAGQIKQ